jgi:hypothetical protein
MGHWFWTKRREGEWTPIYAASEQQAKNKRTEIAKSPDVIKITPIRPVSDTTLPLELNHVIKKGAKDGA